jgi:hypothetical protein
MAVMLGPVERSGRQPDDRPSVQFQPPILCNFTPPLTASLHVPFASMLASGATASPAVQLTISAEATNVKHRWCQDSRILARSVVGESLTSPNHSTSLRLKTMRPGMQGWL